MRVKHERTKVKHLWTNGQAERIIQIIKKDTAKKVFYKTFSRLNLRLTTWTNDYNMNRKLKSIKFPTPYQEMIKHYQLLNDDKCRERFIKTPNSGLIVKLLHCAT